MTIVELAVELQVVRAAGEAARFETEANELAELCDQLLIPQPNRS